MMQKRNARAPGFAALMGLVLLLGCSDGLPPDPSRDNGQDFGEKFFNVICQRMAYTSSVQAHQRSLAANQKDPAQPVRPLDVSGSRYRLACRYGAKYLPPDAQRSDPKVYTLVQSRAELVRAINLIFPDNELSAIQDYLVKILPLTDNDRFPELVDRAVTLLKDQLEPNDKLHWSLARLDHRVGYRPRSVALGVIRELLQYEPLHKDLNTLVGFIGEGGKGHKALLDLVEALGFELRTAEALSGPQGDPQRTLAQALALLFSQDRRLAGGGKPMWLVRRDWRGVARVRRDPKTGALPAPFSDQDGDGLADIDALGRYVTSRASAAVPEPFHYGDKASDAAAARDGQGRALTGDAQLVFDYIDLDTTLLAGLARDALEILDYDKDVAVQLALGASLLLGERKPLTKRAGGESLSYSGYDTNTSAAVDLAHAALQTLRDPNIDATLEAATLLLEKHEGKMARLVDAAMAARDLADKYPGAEIVDGSNLWDDLIPVLQRVVRTPGLTEDIIEALADPRTTNMGGILGNFAEYRDIHTLDKSYDKVLGSDGKAPAFARPVDRSKPDRRESSGADNRSIQQRIMHIINNTNGMKLCNRDNACLGIKVLGQDLCFVRFKACELFEVKNGAHFYVQSIARLRDGQGKLTTTPKATLTLNLPSSIKTILGAAGISEGWVLETISGIKGMTTHPTTEALNRLMFMDKYPQALAMLQDPAVDIDGHTVYSYHLGSLLSLEVPHQGLNHSYPVTFLDAIRPVIQAFADNNAEQLFLDLCSVMHRHWPSRRSVPFHQLQSPMGKDGIYGSAIVNWEPYLAEVMLKTDLMPALTAAAPALKELKLADGRRALPELVKSIAFLVDPQATSTRVQARKRTCKTDAQCGGCSGSGGPRCVGGRCTPRTATCKSDGKSVVTCSNSSTNCLTPYYLFADAFAAKRAALDRARTKGQTREVKAWNDSTSELVDIFFEVKGPATAARFDNRRIVPAAKLLLNFVRERLRYHRAQGDLASWLEDDLLDGLTDALESPLAARGVDFFKLLEGDAAVKKVIYALADHLIDEAKNSPAFRAVLTGMADMTQLLVDDLNLVPVAHALGDALGARVGLVKAALRFAQPALAADDPKRPILVEVLRNAWKEQRPGISPVQTLLDLATEVHRQNPGAGSAYVGQDFKNALFEARDFLENNETGLSKFFQIVKDRCVHKPCN